MFLRTFSAGTYRLQSAHEKHPQNQTNSKMLGDAFLDEIMTSLKADRVLSAFFFIFPKKHHYLTRKSSSPKGTRQPWYIARTQLTKSPLTFV